MPVTKCQNGKWKIGNGNCIYDTKEKAMEVWKAIISTDEYNDHIKNKKHTNEKKRKNNLS